MRKNKSGTKNLELLYTTYEVKGLNLDRLVNLCAKREIPVRDVKKYGNKRMLITVNFKDGKKFFAIAEDLCYNIRKIRDKGRALPYLLLLRSFGLILGGVIFVAMAFFVDDLIFSFSFSGSGSVLKREVEEYLLGRGVTVYSRFSSIDLAGLEDEILAGNPRLSFASCKKVGNRLKIELALSGEGVEVLDTKTQALEASVSGVVESVKVYRGTSVVSVGDFVNAGDTLVVGTVEIKEQSVYTGVLATVSLRTDYVYTYRSEKDEEQLLATIFARESLGDREILSETVEKTQTDGGYEYKVVFTTRVILKAN